MPQNPNTVIEFYHVPWSNNYRDIRYFADRATQSAWFAARSHETYPDGVLVKNAQAIRPGNVYTIRGTWDRFHRFNYCRFINNQYESSEWTYCFITGWHYLSEHSVAFDFEIDAYQNNVGYIVFEPSYIERHHTPGDAVTNNGEPIGVNRYIADFVQNIGEPLSDNAYLLFAGTPPNGKALTGDNNAIMNNRDYNIYLFATDLYSAVKTKIDEFVEGGHSNNILTIIQCPKNYINIASYREISFVAKRYDITRPKPGFTPKNRKSLIYPFQYAYAIDNQSGGREYKWEDGENNVLSFNFSGAVGTAIIAELIKIGGKSNTAYVDNLIMDISVQASWTINGFDNWQATKGQAVAQQANYSYSKQAVNAIAGLVSADAGGNLGQSVGGIIDTYAGAMMQQSQAHFQPACSTVTDTAKQHLRETNRLSFLLYNFHPTTSEWQAIDDFFTRFGYAVGRIATPNPTNRSAFYYVKTAGASVKGEMLPQERNILERMLDNGVTFWRNDDIGNYNQTNN